ncbi:MAG TPA: hypothetical protein VLA05_09455 [Coriobacteriia bacterium]|nr:hypothetical protein [Coriobacteriia bacterium]
MPWVRTAAGRDDPMGAIHVSDRLEKTARVLLWALPIWTLMLLLGTLTHQPDPQTNFGAWSRYVTTDWFLASHLINSILGAAIGSLGFVGLMLYLSDTRAAGRATAAMIAGVLGNTITSAAFGAAAFAQPALGRAFLGGDAGAVALYNDVYAVPLFGSVGVGLLLFIAGGVLAGLAVIASGKLPMWAGWVLLLATPLFALSNIFLPAALQTAAAAGLLVSTLVLAWAGGREGHSGVPFRHTASA